MTFDVNKEPLTNDEVVVLIKHRMTWSMRILYIVLINAVVTNVIGGIANFVGIGVSFSCIIAIFLLNRGGFKQYHMLSHDEQIPIMEWAQHSTVVFEYVRKVKTQPRSFYRGELAALRKQYDLESTQARHQPGV